MTSRSKLLARRLAIIAALVFIILEHTPPAHGDNAGPRICFHPDWPAEDYFTALASILDTLPPYIDEDHAFIDAYDSKPNAPSAGTIEDGNYYGPGEMKYISATEQVLLVPDFQADEGSTITIEIKP